MLMCVCVCVCVCVKKQNDTGMTQTYSEEQLPEGYSKLCEDLNY